MMNRRNAFALFSFGLMASWIGCGIQVGPPIENARDVKVPDGWHRLTGGKVIFRDGYLHGKMDPQIPQHGENVKIELRLGSTYGFAAPVVDVRFGIATFEYDRAKSFGKDVPMRIMHTADPFEGPNWTNMRVIDGRILKDGRMVRWTTPRDKPPQGQLVEWLYQGEVQVAEGANCYEVHITDSETGEVILHKAKTMPEEGSTYGIRWWEQ